MDTVISAFSAENAARIAGLTATQLARWNRLGFFKPSHTEVIGKAQYLRVYTFQDVVGLRVIAVLRNEHKNSIQQLRKVAEQLSMETTRPWSSLKLMVCKGEVSVVDPETGRGMGVFSGQYVLVPIIDQIRHVRRIAADLSRRDADQVGLIARHRNVAHNAPVFAGTRVPVRAVERFLAAGHSIDGILDEYPSLDRKDIETIQIQRSQQAAA